MRYKITITNNENGEVLINEENAVAIIGAITNEQTTRRIGLIKCNAILLANAIENAEKVISTIKNDTPEVNLLLQLSAMADKID